MSEVYPHQSHGWPVPPPSGPVFPFSQPEVLDTAALTARCKNYERRILDLEKQVAELRALLKGRE